MSAPKHERSPIAHVAAGQTDDALRLPGDGTNPASLDKVRDILFGNQMRDVERRFARLEERLVKDTADLKDDVKKRLDTLEAYMRREYGVARRAN